MKNPKMLLANLVLLKIAHFCRSKSVRTAALILAVLILVAAATMAHSQTFAVLYNFGSNPGDPSYTTGLLAQGRDSNLYGTSRDGGTHNLGTVFSITPAGILTVLYNFDATHGSQPWGGLTLGSDGNFYGTAAFGGTLNNGTVFKITPRGKLTVLYNFTNSEDGQTPFEPPVQGTDGNFYGTTCGCPYGGAWAGTVYKITPAGVLTTLHQFAPNGYHDGVNPQNALMQAIDGNFYGTTTNQGTYDRGTIFKITPSGKFTKLHDLSDSNGGRDYGQLVQASDGNFYAPAAVGGQFGDGVVYTLTPAGQYTVLHTFDGNDGSLPGAGLVLATDANFYGLAPAGGLADDGTIYRMGLDGSFSVLYNFDSATGSFPSGLLQHTNGVLYGDTASGGPHSQGTFFGLDAGLGPFARLVRDSGKVGQTGGILGQGFIGTTDVSLNGTPATFTVVSDTYLTATVPVGGTTGLVTVTTAGGTLTSNKIFRVTPQLLSFDPPSGPVGTVVTITGVSLTQTTGVGFGDSVPANFTVDSDSQVTATVPQGAVTGKVSIQTLGGIARSSGTFSVTP